ncbi:MAG: hypothetical protein JRE40_08090 [Deltaproteobacteria bacterium]|nr:hypothetical protein [Deltaproteobacteria bacterium]
MGKDAPDTAPDDGTYEWKDKATGQIRQVPKGIDPGWAYNVGEASGKSYRMLTDKFETLPADIARQWVKSYVQEPAFERFIAGQIEGEFPVAVMDGELMTQIGTGRQAVWLSSDAVMQNQAAGLTLEDYQRLPVAIGQAAAVTADEAGVTLRAQIDGATYRTGIRAGEINTVTFFDREEK